MDVRVNVERGELADVPGAQAVLAEARQWLADRSLDQWRDPLPDRVIEEDVRRGRLFVVRADGGLAGMLSIAHSDEDTWGPDSASALYVHRLAVAHRYRGAQLGRKLLRWARTYVTVRDRWRRSDEDNWRQQNPNEDGRRAGMAGLWAAHAEHLYSTI